MPGKEGYLTKRLSGTTLLFQPLKTSEISLMKLGFSYWHAWSVYRLCLVRSRQRAGVGWSSAERHFGGVDLSECCP